MPEKSVSLLSGTFCCFPRMGQGVGQTANDRFFHLGCNLPSIKVAPQKTRKSPFPDTQYDPGMSSTLRQQHFCSGWIVLTGLTPHGCWYSHQAACRSAGISKIQKRAVLQLDRCLLTPEATLVSSHSVGLNTNTARTLEQRIKPTETAFASLKSTATIATSGLLRAYLQDGGGTQQTLSKEVFRFSTKSVDNCCINCHVAVNW